MADHRPVMLREVLDALAPIPQGAVLDATVGLGGHAAALLAARPGLRLVGLDLDPQALAAAGERLASLAARTTLAQRSYVELDDVLDGLAVARLSGALFDLGVSSLQLDTPERGFSFRHDAPLDMRFSGAGTTAGELLATMSEEELVRMLREWGEEPRARRVARAIVQSRARAPLRTTKELRNLVAASIGRAGGRIDPATRVFQALRIATNRELDGIGPALESAARRLAPAGRLAVIAFHSLEDRIVKQTLRRLSGRCACPPELPACRCGAEPLLDIVTPRPLRPSDEETLGNPRARPARLRVAERRSA